MLSAAENAGATGTGAVTGEDGPSGRASLWLWAVLGAGAILRLVAIGYKSFWIDEIASVAIARRAAPVFWRFLWHDEGNMAAYYVLLRPWLRLGYAEGTVRLLSVLGGVLSLPVMYFLGRRLFGRGLAILATMFLAVNACAISVSQEARAYGFVLLAVLLSTYLFVRFIEEPGWGGACAYAVVAGLSCYFHYFCVLVPAAQYAAVIGMRPERRPWKYLFVAAAIIGILAAPMLWLMHAQDTGHISWVRPPSWLELYHLGAYLAAASGKAVGAVLLAINLALVPLFFKSLIRRWSDVEQRWRDLLAASLLLTPVVITLLVSAVRPVFYHRFLIICLPGLLLITARGVAEIRSLTLQVVAVSAICGLSLASTFILYHRVTEDWRGATDYLIANARPEDRVLYYQSLGQFAVESYRDWLPGGSSARPMPIPVNPPSSAWQETLDDAPQVWLVLYRVKPSDVEVRAIEQDLEKRYRVVGQKDFRGVSIAEYERR